MKLAPTIKLIRLHQYIKNLFIFLPLFFGIKITDLGLLSNAFIAFIAFSLTASAIYILNDYHDIEEDRQHPKNKDRPLASGTISKSQAIIIMSVLFVLGFTLMALLSFKAAGVLLFFKPPIKLRIIVVQCLWHDRTGLRQTLRLQPILIPTQRCGQWNCCGRIVHDGLTE